MKKNKIKIYSTMYKNMTHNIFKFTNKSIPDYSIDFYLNETPYKVINEDEYLFSTRVLSVELNIEKDVLSKYLTLKAPFDFIKENGSINIEFYNENLLLKQLEIIFENGNIKSASITDADLITTVIVDLDEYIGVFSNNSIDVSIDKFNYKKINLITAIDFLDVVDDESNGVFTPNISYTQSSTHFYINQNYYNSFNNYHYLILSNNEDSISQLSSIVSSKIAEPIEELKFVLETFNYKDSTWDFLLEDEVINGFIIDKRDLKLLIDDFQGFYSNEIKFDDRILNSSGIRTILIPNVWHDDKSHIHSRQYKKIRTYNYLKNNPLLKSKNSNEIIFDEAAKVYIDKMIVLKSNVTLLSESNQKQPIPISNKDNIIKEYIRRGGVFYEELEVNNGIIEYTDSVARFPIINLVDSCISFEKYNYTIYLIDEFEKISNPIVVVR